MRIYEIFGARVRLSARAFEISKSMKLQLSNAVFTVSVRQRIDSYMSNTFLGRMRATGQLKEAPVSKGFFERYKKKSKKAKKGVKIEPKKEGDKQLKQLKFLVGKKD